MRDSTSNMQTSLLCFLHFIYQDKTQKCIECFLLSLSDDSVPLFYILLYLVKNSLYFIIFSTSKVSAALT